MFGDDNMGERDFRPRYRAREGFSWRQLSATVIAVATAVASSTSMIMHALDAGFSDLRHFETRIVHLEERMGRVEEAVFVRK